MLEQLVSQIFSSNYYYYNKQYYYLLRVVGGGDNNMECGRFLYYEVYIRYLRHTGSVVAVFVLVGTI